MDELGEIPYFVEFALLYLIDFIVKHCDHNFLKDLWSPIILLAH